MKVGKFNYAKLNRVFLITLVFVFLLLFQSCKKNDISNDIVYTSEQPNEFFKISKNVPEAVITIITQMRNDLKEKDIQNFISWYGQPLWNRIIKLNTNKGAPNTYAIPIQKKGEITGFIAATINSINQIKFEMHRKGL